jgi:GNAT superfamily N-acetyltransferase
MIVRKATASDLPAVGDLILEQSSLEPDQAIRLGTIHRVACDAVIGGETLFVAVDDVVVGVCVWVEFPGDATYVVAAGTFVAASHFRRGVGRALREAAEEYWTDKGATDILASVSVANEAGIESLLDFGFEHTGYEMAKHIGGSR